MTPDIERLAKEAGIVLDYYYVAKDLDVLAKFAALVAEECAMVVDAEGVPVSGVWLPELDFQRKYAAAIRANFALSNDRPEAK